MPKLVEILDVLEDLKLLSNGQDPQTKELIVSDTIIKSNYNKDVLNKAIELIEEYLKLSTKSKKTPFYIPKDKIIKVPLSDVPISISKFTYSINSVIPKNMKKAQARDFTAWLVSLGYLQIITRDNREYRELTSRSKEIGLSSEERKNSLGKSYSVNLYNKEAQKFILHNLDEFIKFSNNQSFK